RECRIFLQLDVAADKPGLARAALAFLAAMHQGDALTEGRVENGFPLRDIHLDADRFEMYLVEHCFRHAIPTGLKTRPGAGAPLTRWRLERGRVAAPSRERPSG